MNKVYALMGPPACGKTSIAKELRQYDIPEIISHTTRAARSEEKHGEDYYFVSDDEFNKMQLIERVSYSGKFYGLSKAEVLGKVNKYPVSVVTIDVNGLDQIKALLGERAELIFILVDDVNRSAGFSNHGCIYPCNGKYFSVIRIFKVLQNVV